MSIETTLDDRYKLWFELLCTKFGFDEQAPSRPPTSRNEVVLRAVRPRAREVEAVAVDIREAWLEGADPDGIGLELNGCYLAVASWHAQIVPADGEQGAERLDVDRRKPSDLLVHRHPLGLPNECRDPAAPLKHPEAWVVWVEGTIAAYYGY